MEVRILAARYDEDAAQAALMDWVEAGWFSRKDVAQGLNHHAELTHLPFLSTQVHISTTWEAEGGRLNDREFTRDMNAYKDQHQRWENSGKQGRSPTRPDKDHYVDWVANSGSREDNYTFKQLAVSPSAFTNSQAQVACEGMSSSVWSAWGEAALDINFNVEDLPWEDLKKSAFDQASSKSIKAAEKDAKRGWSKIRGLSAHSNAGISDSDVIEYPFYFMHYSFNGSDHAFVFDAYKGEALGGSRPKDVRKIGLWIGITGTLLAAIFGISYLLSEKSGQITPAGQDARSNLTVGRSGKLQLPSQSGGSSGTDAKGIADAPNTAAQDQFGGVKIGMPYLTARKLLITNGFVPVKQPDWDADVQKDFPEVQTCSNGAGYCAMYFSKDKRPLSVGTQGGAPDASDPTVTVTDIDWMQNPSVNGDNASRQPVVIQTRSLNTDVTSSPSLALNPIPENALNSDNDATYGFTCQVRNSKRQLILYTTDPTASDQSRDGTAMMGNAHIDLHGDRDVTRNGTLRLRNGTTTILVELNGKMVAAGDAGDEADGEGNLTAISGGGTNTISITISCIEN